MSPGSASDTNGSSGEMQHGLGAKRVLEHPIRAGERLFLVAEAELVVERDVGAAPPGEMLEVRKGAGGLQRIVDDRGRAYRLGLVIDGGKLFVVGLDQPHRLFGHVRIGGQHDCDRLTGRRTLSCARIGWSWNAGPEYGSGMSRRISAPVTT